MKKLLLLTLIIGSTISPMENSFPRYKKYALNSAKAFGGLALAGITGLVGHSAYADYKHYKRIEQRRCDEKAEQVAQERASHIKELRRFLAHADCSNAYRLMRPRDSWNKCSLQDAPNEMRTIAEDILRNKELPCSRLLLATLASYKDTENINEFYKDLKMHPLHEAVGFENSKAARYLLESGFDANDRDAAGNTPIHRIHDAEHAQEMLPALVAFGADINAVNEREESVLHNNAFMSIWIRKGDGASLMKEMLAYKPNPFKKDKQGYMPAELIEERKSAYSCSLRKAAPDCETLLKMEDMLRKYSLAYQQEQSKK